MTVQELTYNMVFDWKKKSFDNFNKSLGQVTKSFAKLSGVVLAGQGVAFGMSKNIADANDQLAKQSKRLNLTSEQYQKLGFAVEDSGATLNDLTGSLQALSKAQEDVLLGKGDLQAFSQLGINPSEFNNTNDLLLAISDSISQIDSDSKKISLLERVGISRNLLQALENGSGELNKLGNEFARLGGVVSEDQKKTAAEFQAQWLRATTRTKGIYNTFSTALLKGTNKFLDKFNDLSEQQIKSFEKKLNEVISVIGKLSDYVLKAIQGIISLFTRFSNVMGGVENAVLAIGGAFLFIKRQMVRSLVLPIAMLGILYLAIDDVLSALEGKDSYFKDFIPADVLTSLGDIISKLGEYKLELGLLAGVFVLLGKNITIVAGAIMALHKAYEKIKGWVGKFTDSFNNRGSSLAGVDQISQMQKSFTLDQKGTIPSNNSNFNITINGADGNAVQELNTYLQSYSDMIGGK